MQVNANRLFTESEKTAGDILRQRALIHEIGYAETRAIITSAIANNLPIDPRLCPYSWANQFLSASPLPLTVVVDED